MAMPKADRASLRNRVGTWIASRIAAVLLRLLGATWRFSIEGPSPFVVGSGPHLGAFWHRDALIAAYCFRDRGYSVPVSRSRDGDLITGLLLGLGYRAPPRGSSSRGGASALRSLEKMIADGTTISIQTDGPRGPARVSKHGMMSLSRRTGIPITPVAFSAKPCFRFGSWDGTLLPLPFASVICSFGPSIPVERGADVADELVVREHLDRELNRLTDEADDRCGLIDPNRPRVPDPG
jgi:lysophospholipid acyltransferase (LPLAT)-like uncharacterized protein